MALQSLWVCDGSQTVHVVRRKHASLRSCRHGMALLCTAANSQDDAAAEPHRSLAGRHAPGDPQICRSIHTLNIPCSCCCLIYHFGRQLRPPGKSFAVVVICLQSRLRLYMHMRIGPATSCTRLWPLAFILLHSADPSDQSTVCSSMTAAQHAAQPEECRAILPLSLSLTR